jgi:hypothetical protein
MSYCVMKSSEVLLREENKLMSYKLIFRPGLPQTPVRKLGTLPVAASSVGKRLASLIPLSSTPSTSPQLIDPPPPK